MKIFPKTKAIREVGLKKTLRFLFYALFEVLYHLLINHLLYLPPIRKMLLQLFQFKIGKDSIVMDVRFTNLHHLGPKGLTIGSKCFVSDEVLVDLYDAIDIGDSVTIAQKVSILTHLNVGYQDHPLQKYFPKQSKKVTIKSGSFIGAGSIILPGVTIGEESFVAAGSVVTENVSPRTLVGGVPAKLIRKIK